LVAVARYGAIGESSSQRQVVLPPCVALEISRPFPIAVIPSGTVIEMSNVALSRGLSLDGYQPGAPCVGDDERAVGRQDPALAAGVGIDHLRWLAGVPDLQDGWPPRTQPDRRRDDQLLAVAGEARREAVDGQPRDLEATEVEVEPAQALRRRRGDDGRRVELVAGALVVEAQRVVPHVVAAVSGEREVRIPDAGGAGDERLCGRPSDRRARECSGDNEAEKATPSARPVRGSA
jgi:hypothetical protein